MTILVNDGEQTPILVHSAVVKHQSHNQASHGRGGSGAGGGGELAEGGVNLSVRNHRAEAKEIETDIKADGGSSALGDVQNAHMAISGERGPLTTKMASPQEMRGSLKESATSLQSAGKKLAAEGKDALASRVNALAQKVISTHNNTPNY